MAPAESPSRLRLRAPSREVPAEGPARFQLRQDALKGTLDSHQESPTFFLRVPTKRPEAAAFPGAFEERVGGSG